VPAHPTATSATWTRSLTRGRSADYRIGSSVQGAVRSPGRFWLTGTESISDAIAIAGGPDPRGNVEKVLLYRGNSRGEPERLTVNANQLEPGKLQATEYVLKPGDRLVVIGRVIDPANKSGTRPNPSRPPTAASSDAGAFPYFQAATEDLLLQRLERRMDSIDLRLDLILEALRKRAR
jgi:SLBB domain